uniref:Uncharacterized protein n=2 Tax=Oryza sativa subsp. japonica TaxID=39947 RepID=Q10E88_ORYSJ|nr:hypothetical protein [Oryza sativa Japonica Group]ABF98448.1 hypothetical protein LOC_Os03g49740 [Oryza sativa Japonica Group]
MWPLLADGGKRKKQSGYGGRIPALNTLTPLSNSVSFSSAVAMVDNGFLACAVAMAPDSLSSLLEPAVGRSDSSCGQPREQPCAVTTTEAAEDDGPPEREGDGKASAYDTIKRMIPVAEEVVKAREIVTKGGAAGSRPCPPIPVIPSEASDRGGRGRGGDAEDGAVAGGLTATVEHCARMKSWVTGRCAAA